MGGDTKRGRRRAGARVIIGSLALVAALASLGCRTAGPTAERSMPDTTDPGASEPSNRPVLMVGTSASAPPYAFREGGRMVGLEIDLAREAAERMGRRPVFVSMFFPDLPIELSQGRIDVIMTGLSVTPERAERMAFTEPYLRISQQAVIRGADAGRFPSVDRLNREGVRVGVEQGSSGYRWVADRWRRARAVAFPTVADAIEALRLGQIDAVVHDRPTLTWMLRRDATGDLRPLPGRLTDEPIAWAVHPDQRTLLAELNAARAAMEADGALERVKARWLGSAAE